MSKIKLEQSIGNLGQALDRLEEALAVPEGQPLAIDGTIQRFEFSLELFWKTLKRLLAEEGVKTTTPRETLKEAWQAGWLTDEDMWLDLLKARNETSHNYDEGAARRIYQTIRGSFPEMRRVYEQIKAVHSNG